MNGSIRGLGAGLALAFAALLSACGGSGGAPEAAVMEADPQARALAVKRSTPSNVCDATSHQTILAAVPAPGGGSPGDATSLTVHYRRPAGDYAGWQIHTFGAAQDPGWNNGWNANPVGDAFGVIYHVPLIATSGNVGYLFHQGDNKDHGGADQSYTLKPGANSIWRIQGDPVTYFSDPLNVSVPDIASVRVHYKRYDANYTQWGVHIWPGSGIDTARLKPGVAIDRWDAPVGFGDFNNAYTGPGEVVFEIPVLNPKDDPSRKTLEFIIHGFPPNSDNKDGRGDNIRVTYSALTIANQVGDIWLVQEDPTVYTTLPDLRIASTTDARAYWLDRQLIQWPKVDSTGAFKLYHSATGQIVATKDAPVSGADAAVALEVFSGAVPAAAAQRFKYVGAGTVLKVKAARRQQLRDLHASQLVLVQEDAAGKVQNATTAQVAGALDELFAQAAHEDDLGVDANRRRAQFKLWAPTAQKVLLCLYDSATGAATGAERMEMDESSGIWSETAGGRPAGKYYKYAVEVFVRGVGLVRNLVTDPYSLSLSADSKRSYIADLDAAALKPHGWDDTRAPATVRAQVDMTIYELHVRDFSINDATVSDANRGKYTAFTEAGSNGMKHLKALANSGLTDVHLLPVFDIATVPETGCVTPAVSGAADGEAQQAAIHAVRDADCFNWGYDPYHYTAPEGSYSTDPADGAKRIIEFRRMVQALHRAGLRVGMDVVYNHTTASGQNEKSVLDRIVPGYYHRLNPTGGVERSTCCDNTATENLMMAKLMTDSVLTWATQYRIDSFRFDLMGHQPRAVMEALKAKLRKATGRDIHLIGEGWNFGEVANGARFVQASQLSLNGSGIGTFSDRARDHVRGGGPFDGGESLVKNQGYINGLVYDRNALAPDRPINDLMWAGDIIKVGLAGSIRDYPLKTHWDEVRQLQQLDYNGQPAGYVVDPDEVVNYVENHDNQTLFDINAYKLPTATSKEDRARVQILGAAINAFSQGVAYFHAGIDTLRSKSMDRNSYNSGDWFNRLDWTYADNYFGSGAPPQADNGDNWFLIKPLLANPAIKPSGSEIEWTRDAFRDILKLRSSSTLLRLRSADDIKTRLTFYNTGSTQVPTVLAGHVNGAGYPGARFRELMYFVNVDKVAQSLTLEAQQDKAFVLHPVHTAPGAADARAANDSSYDAASGRFTIPPRTAVVYVVN